MAADLGAQQKDAARPAGAVPDTAASALARDDGREGGVLIVLAKKPRADAARAAIALALEARMWNNGSRR
ncbi:MAG: hypothetical protein JO153_11775 [Solirubrobacterales bacterium]|nr:hypothetical protein [Solirubrobacterales bacterium]MBV9917169.1 hypothetical protein [Solirubrobacterales bacterium]